MYEMDEKCQKCKNNGTAICNRCDMFYDEFEPIDEPKQTNADRIRSMSDAELANELLEWYAVFSAVEWTKDMILEWLRKEVRE